VEAAGVDSRDLERQVDGAQAGQDAGLCGLPGRVVGEVPDVAGGADPFAAACDVRHFAESETRRTKQARALMTPDEILALPEDRQLLFVSGKNLRPLLAWKYPYFTRAEMAGLYLPNPYHPPADTVPVRTRWGSAWRPVVTAPLPKRLAAFPQHRDGTLRYVRGFKP